VETVVCGVETVVCGVETVVCGVETVDRSTISRWAQRFCEERLSIQNDPKSGRPRTSTDDQSVERVLQILEEDRGMKC